MSHHVVPTHKFIIFSNILSISLNCHWHIVIPLGKQNCKLYSSQHKPQFPSTLCFPNNSPSPTTTKIGNSLTFYILTLQHTKLNPKLIYLKTGIQNPLSTYSIEIPEHTSNPYRKPYHFNSLFTYNHIALQLE